MDAPQGNRAVDLPDGPGVLRFVDVGQDLGEAMSGNDWMYGHVMTWREFGMHLVLFVGFILILWGLGVLG